jgi:phage-related protein
MRRWESISMRQDGLFQIRIYHRGIWYRLIYFYEEEKAIVCHGFIKKTNKTPPKERQIALDRMKDHQKRFKKKDTKDAKKKKEGQCKKRK